MNYCCESFKRLVDNAGQKGVGVVHAIYLGNRQFILQARPFDKDVYEYHSKVDLATGKNSWPNLTNANGEMRGMALITNQSMRFCPLCGKELLLLIKAEVVEFDKLAIEQAPLLKG